MEIGGNSLNFLDVTLIKNNNKIEFDWFHKPTFSGRYLSFLSLHPITQKKGSLISMIDRTLLLSHPRYHTIRILISLLTPSYLIDYPLNFIFNTINLSENWLINELYIQIMKTTTMLVKLIGSLYHIFRISRKDSKISLKIKTPSYPFTVSINWR